ncbi:Hint domain-containing protein [Lutimaribacter sp. EGI FJ00015]|uniref:Hint domain-containing protein n=1 Tax=Lutimaribacter degradans TaxID=2945989 RepID=A0ACC5ZWE7_9RHOB|nr:Hint domain-containing protein [Lutimaribacter sp. EGI FJ00013]MCM2562381.1 Hint domain-containing protein [Lutimaribacter sp. EGI FJ00013]MCO0613538.1 Hint domain-containing protein [Lutimaribacter sp. EGI FJ00015]MCO0636510.1 Hint domain-containing protein [Lutimaribacter sp. EGI FJ00014]
MPTTFSLFYLGDAPEIDTVEGNTYSENDSALNGMVFGGSGNEIASNLQTLSDAPSDNYTGGTSSAYDANNLYWNESFSIDGGPLQVHDATMLYNGTTIRYTDGTTATVDAIVMQDTNGSLYLLPPTTGPNAYSDALEAKPISSVTLGTSAPANGFGAYGMTADRYVLTVNDFTVEGTVGNDVIDAGYDGDPQGDRVDGSDNIAGTNDDMIEAHDGDDLVFAGDGADTVDGGTGNDTLNGQAGNDLLIGDTGDDLLDGGAGADTLVGGAGSDTAIGSEGADEINLNNGQDYVDYSGSGGAVNVDLTTNTGSGGYAEGDTYQGVDGVTGSAFDDTITGFDGQSFDQEDGYTNDLSGGGGNDRISGLGGGDTLRGGTGNDTLYGGAGQDTVSGDEGDDYIFGDSQGLDTDDYLSGGGGTATSLTVTNQADAPIELWWIDGEGTLQFYATIQPGDTHVQPTFTDHNWVLRDEDGLDLEIIEGAANQSVTYGPDLDDSLIGGAGNDTIHGQHGDDTILGGAGDDVIHGGPGADHMMGEAGNDVFTLTSGDTATGGDGDDVFNVGPGDLAGGTLTVDGSEGAETDGDTLNITGPAEIIHDSDDPEAGTVTWLDGTTLSFSNIENVNYVPCFTADSLIKTLRGEVRAVDIRLGDMVLTRDAGYQPVRWTGARRLSPSVLRANPELRPVRIGAGALGCNQPEHDLTVSPQHRVLIGSALTQLWFGEEEVLVAAHHLTCLDRVKQVRPDTGVTYVHMMFDNHQIICGDGAWSESFQPGDMTLAGMDGPQREELFAVFPSLRRKTVSAAYPAARITLKAHEARVLALA